MIGVLPGLGPAAGTAILIPMTAALDPTGSIIMLAAIYYGAMYGGTITSVLLNTPGEAASAITCLDGYAMAKKGRAGAALSIAAIGSFVGGIVSTAGIVLLALPLTRVALSFGPPEIFALLLVGLCMVVGLAGTSLLKAMLAAVLGLLLSQIGSDPILGNPRFTGGQQPLLDGVNIVAVVMGLFGIAELLVNLENKAAPPAKSGLNKLFPTSTDLKASAAPIARGTIIGFFLGLVPGLGTMIPAFLSYVVEKRLSKTPERFSHGAIEGVAGPETANNAAANGALIPLLTLGIPGSAVTAILMGAFMMNGIIPGPMLFIDHGELAWAVVASLVVGNAMLIILNLPFIPIWVALLRVPFPILLGVIILFCVIGSYSLNGNVFDIGVMAFFGIVGYLLKKLSIPATPLILTLVLGGLMERALRQSLEMASGEFLIFVTRPISASLVVIAAIVLIMSTASQFRQFRQSDAEV